MNLGRSTTRQVVPIWCSVGTRYNLATSDYPRLLETESRVLVHIALSTVLCCFSACASFGYHVTSSVVRIVLIVVSGDVSTRM